MTPIKVRRSELQLKSVAVAVCANSDAGDAAVVGETCASANNIVGVEDGLHSASSAALSWCRGGWNDHW